MLVC